MKTFTSVAGATLALPRLVPIAARYRRFRRSQGFAVVVSGMEQVWQSPVARMFTGRTRYLSCLHDARRHYGEESRIRDLMRRLELSAADGVMTFSASVEQELLNSHPGFRGRSWRSVHGAFSASLGADPMASSVTEPTGGIRRRAWAVGGRPLRLGVFGRLLPYKGLHLAVRVLQEVRARGIEAELFVHGKGDPGYVAAARQPGVTVVNAWVAEHEVHRVLDTFDVLLLPYVEASQSGVMAFAMTLGLPAVATPVGGLVEQVDGRGGVVAARMDVAALADAVERLARDPAHYAAVSAAGLRAAADEFSWRRVAEDTALAAGQLSRMPRRKTTPSPREKAPHG